MRTKIRRRKSRRSRRRGSRRRRSRRRRKVVEKEVEEEVVEKEVGEEEEEIEVEVEEEEEQLILSQHVLYLHAPPTPNGSDVSTVFAKLSVCNRRITDSHQISYPQLQWPAGYRRCGEDGQTPRNVATPLSDIQQKHNGLPYKNKPTGITTKT
jgi:hypothetical protein